MSQLPEMEEQQYYYLRYYTGHKGRFGHEFLEFELHPDGLLRYANNSNYKRDTMIIKELRVGRIVRNQILNMLTEAGAFQTGQLDDKNWPPPNRDGRQSLEVIVNGEHINLCTCKVGSVLDIQACEDPEGLRSFHYLVQDLKTLILSLVSIHFKINPI